ncbi:MAG: filamentous hemagglutinin N-terminal domain-containing protein [Waterburya sp.]
MPKIFSPWLQISLCTFGYFYATSNTALAQVTSDGTVNTQVTENGNVAEITGGETRGGNLFHSFRDFSVGTGNEAAFLNANDISNIFSRVTGGNISNIDGLIRSNGSANLFLINPAGIIFGENARLDVGGSFYGSSASSILFEDGEFSATDLENPPVLTINAPIGLNFRDNPGDIVNRSNLRETEIVDEGTEFESTEINRIGLQVNQGKNLALIGGNVSLEDSGITAPGGVANLGGLTSEGTVSFADDGSLSFPEGIARGDVSLTKEARVSVVSGGGGSIFVNAKNLDLTSGNFLAGIGEGLGSVNAKAGDVVINATESVSIDRESSYIFNDLNFGAVGNSGEINITTPNLTVTDGGAITTDTIGQGNSGAININATESVTIDGEDSFAGIFSNVFEEAVGNGGAINITTSNLILTNGGTIDTSTYGAGDGGDININSTESISIDGELVPIEEGFSLVPAGISSIVYGGAEGNGGAINITTSNLTLTDGGSIDTDTTGKGDGGDININATESVSIDGEPYTIGGETEFYSGNITSTALKAAEGNGGEINITTSNLTLTDGSTIDTSTIGAGDAGNILIKADTLSLEGSEISAANIPFEPATNNQAPKTGGNITLEIADDLTLRNNSTISGEGGSKADGGNVNIDTNFIVAFPEGNNDILANAEQGEGGNININAQAILGIAKRPLNKFTNDINASSQVTGLDGTVNLNTLGINPVQGATELPSNVVEPEQTTEQACQADRETAAKNGLIINGKGGIPATPDEPLTSQNLTINGEIISASPIPEPIETSQGKIQLARGIKFTKDGGIILTAYPTNNAGERVAVEKRNCVQ